MGEEERDDEREDALFPLRRGYLVGWGSRCVMNKEFELADEGGEGMFSTSTDRLLSDESKEG